MAKIIHYMSHDNLPHEVVLTYGAAVQTTEYIVITEDTEPFEWKRKNFVLDKVYELEDVGVLPTDRILVP